LILAIPVPHGLRRRIEVFFGAADLALDLAAFDFRSAASSRRNRFFAATSAAVSMAR
jgi:hypothetical protein